MTNAYLFLLVHQIDKIAEFLFGRSHQKGTGFFPAKKSRWNLFVSYCFQDSRWTFWSFINTY